MPKSAVLAKSQEQDFDGYGDRDYALACLFVLIEQLRAARQHAIVHEQKLRWARTIIYGSYDQNLTPSRIGSLFIVVRLADNLKEYFFRNY
jgi:hypothetical protein